VVIRTEQEPVLNKPVSYSSNCLIKYPPLCVLCHVVSVKHHRITESQNGRGWKGPLWVTQSNPLPKQGHPEQAAQDRVQVGLEYLQRRRLHNLPGLLLPLGERHYTCLQQKPSSKFSLNWEAGREEGDRVANYHLCYLLTETEIIPERSSASANSVLQGISLLRPWKHEHSSIREV